MTKFVYDGNTIFVQDNFHIKATDILEPATYTVQFNMKQGYYLEKTSDLEVPTKLYGDVERRANRIIKTFLDRPKSTGVLLSGERGSGKSMLAKLLSKHLIERHNIPTFVVSAAYAGTDFNIFLDKIQQPVMILIDEMEKVYNKEDQERLLSALDGVVNSKKMFVATVNDKYALSAYMHNRPGRFFYALDYKGLDEQFIVEYCEDKLNNKEHIKKVCQVASIFSSFNFDMLKALVEDMNRYDEDPFQAMSMLNIKPEFSPANTWEVNKIVFAKNPQILAHDDEDKKDMVYRLNPLNFEFSPYIATALDWQQKEKEDEAYDDYEYARFVSSGMESFGTDSMVVKSVCGKYIAFLDKKKDKEFDYSRLF